MLPALVLGKFLHLKPGLLKDDLQQLRTEIMQMLVEEIIHARVPQDVLEVWDFDIEAGSHLKTVGQLLEKYKIEGFPTVILFNSEGKEFTRFFASQFPKTELFLKHIDEALEKKDLD